MNDNTSFKSLAQLLKEAFKQSANKVSSVRFRPVVKAVARKYAIAYALSIAEKHCITAGPDCISYISYTPEAWKRLVKSLRNEDKDTLDYNTIHSISLDCAKHAVELCVAAGSPINFATVKPSWNSLGLYLDIVSVVNRRRRQEDRWFASADLLNYLPRTDSEAVSHGNHPSVAAIGVFDGHNGPEAAEHCSHLAPYFLSIALKKRLGGTFSITDVLSEVICLLNESLNEGRAKCYWSAGTTGTICVFYGNRIYTGWVGDSQAWLIYADPTDVPAVTEPVRNHSSLSPVALIPTGLVTHCDAAEEDSDIDGKECNPCDVPDSSLLGVDAVNGGENRERRVSAVLASSRPTDDLAVALTDRIHRPEFAPEFVSVLRAGGSVSTEVMSERDAKCTKETFVNMRPNDPYWAKPPVSALACPPLNDPDLIDCRVAGMSCVSRALGDDQTVNGMSALPSMTIWERSQPASESRSRTAQPLCLILASDGLWDTEDCSGPDVAVISRRWFCEHATPEGVVEPGLSRALTQLAIEHGASDNVTCCVVWLNRWAGVASNTIDYGFDVPSNAHVQWPLGLRTASQIDFVHSDTRPLVRGPRSGFGMRPAAVPNGSSLAARRASQSEIARALNRVRYSSPPRMKSSVP